jgi:predicted lipoprotein with Yx(FWY)xxD motif
MSRFLTIAAVSAGLLVAGCGGDDDDDSDGASGGGATATEAAAAPETDTAAQPAGGAGVTIKTSDSEFGSILFDGDDQAIYLFDKESSSKSECYGACAEAWPPVLTEGDPQAGAGADASLLGTTKRNDGTTQVTYNGHPLYYYHNDPPGQVLCHDVDEFGGLWLVVKPNGDAVPPA